MIKKHYPNPRENSWIHLCQIPQIDETYHLPLEFSFNDSVIETAGVFKTLFGGMIFVLTLQLALFVDSFKVVHLSTGNYFFKFNSSE